jgi:hypothetical protein
MNESEIFSKDKSEKERFKRFETLQSSQSRNDRTLHFNLEKFTLAKNPLEVAW